MVDIVPASVLANVSAQARQEIEARQQNSVLENQIPASDPSDFDVMPEMGQGQQNKDRGPLYSFLALLVVIFVSGIILFVYRDNVMSAFRADDNTATIGQNAAYNTLDEDNDGLTTLEELASGTLVTNADTDEDGLPDGYEIATGLSPLNALDAAKDNDEDGLNNADEFVYQTNPNDPDSDKDGFKDGAEVRNGFNPNGQGELAPPEGESIEDAVFQNVVSIDRENFNPAFLRVRKGDSVAFVNNDNVSHAVTGPEIETGNILPGKSFVLEFPEEGTYEFFDKNNSNFAGKVIVQTGTGF